MPGRSCLAKVLYQQRLHRQNLFTRFSNTTAEIKSQGLGRLLYILVPEVLLLH